MKAHSDSPQAQELQILEHNLQHLLMQKQQLQLELNEVSNALNELNGSNEEVYRVLSSIMVKANKPVLKKELEEKKKILELRMSAVDKQEVLIEGKLNQIKSEKAPADK